MAKKLNENLDNAAIIFSIIYAMYKFLAFEDTRKKILSMEKLLSAVLKLLKSTNNRVVFISMQFLEIVQLFEPSHSEKVKKKKFKIYNKQFISHIESLEKDDDYDKYDYDN